MTTARDDKARTFLRAIAGERAAAMRWEAQSRLTYAVRYRASRRALRTLRNQHVGERCFILGNGPSLNETNLELLRDEFTFGLNRIYLAFERLGFTTSCLVCTNRHIFEQSGRELGAVPMPKFFSTAGEPFIPRSASDVVYLRSAARWRFSQDPVKRGVWEGATVTFVAMQLAHWLGFEQVVLVGVDHNFSAKGRPHELVTAEGPDSDHFDPNYFSAGYRWQLPDLKGSEWAFSTARSAFEGTDRQILDATVGGKLTIFPKVTLEDLF